MAGDLDLQYSETNDNLQDAINEALLQLGNARSQVNSLTSLAQDVSLPTAPGAADVEFPSAPSAPSIAYPADIAFTPVNPTVANPRFPTAPGVASTNTWSGPGRPTAPFQFKQFFTGTPDTPEEVIDRANGAVNAWVDAYFPAVNDCFKDVPEKWICDVVSGVRPLGNSEQAIDIAWIRAKANEHTQLRSDRSTIAAEFSSRGFTMPPGMMVAQMRRAQERFSDSVAGVNREAALADVSVQTELLKLAVSTAADLKRGMASIMAQYFNTVTGVQDRVSETNNERARIVATAEAQFLTSLTAYESINQNYYKSLNDMKLEESRTRIGAYSAEVGAVSEETRAAIQAAQFQLDSSRQRLDAAIAKSQAGNANAQTKADVYRAQTSAYGTAVSTEVAKAQLDVSLYEAEVNALLGKAGLSTSSGAGTALSGVAQAFGNIAAAASNASGTLVAQIESF
jgi:hypothetical protein